MIRGALVVVWGERNVAEVSHFAYGWVNPVLSYVMSMLGCLLGLVFTAKAHAHHGRERFRLLAYASIAIGGIAIWQAHVLALIGFAVSETVVRYDLPLLVYSLAGVIGAIGAGLFILGRGRLRVRRLVLANLLIGVGLAGAHYASMAAVHTTGSIDHEPVRLIGSIVLDLATAGAVMWFVAMVKELHTAVLTAPLLSAVICGTHYVGMSSVRVHLGEDTGGVAGVSPLLLVGPVVLVGAAAAAMLWFFTIGSSTVADPPAIFDERHSIELEPWMNREGAAGVAVAPRRTWAGSRPVTELPVRRPPGPRPPTGVAPPWRSSPVWGSDSSPRVGNGRSSGTTPRIEGIRWHAPAILTATQSAGEALFVVRDLYPSTQEPASSPYGPDSTARSRSLGRRRP